MIEQYDIGKDCVLGINGNIGIDGVPGIDGDTGIGGVPGTDGDIGKTEDVPAPPEFTGITWKPKKCPLSDEAIKNQ